MRVLDLFSAAAGGWSLGLHRAGFETIAACEVVEWRRILYSENNPGVRVYEDVRSLTAERLAADLGTLPDIIVGSPPCQDISSANNAKGKGVDGARSGLFFEAIRLIGECRPRWFALENSADLRTKGADRLISRLAGLGYPCWPVVVRARDVGANHIRPRAWLLGCDPDQVLQSPLASLQRRPLAVGEGVHVDASQDGRAGGRPWGHRTHGDSPPPASPSHAADRNQVGQQGLTGTTPRGHGRAEGQSQPGPARCDVTDTDREGQPHGAGDAGEVAWRSSASGDADQPWSQWNRGLAHHLRLDDGLSAWVAQSRIALGSPRGAAAAGLLVEAFGDSVLPQIPEAIGRAILRTEAALAAIYGSPAQKEAA